jgi:hypothetical protein
MGSILLKIIPPIHDLIMVLMCGYMVIGGIAIAVVNIFRS